MMFAFADLVEVLLEAPFDPIRRQMNSVLLTIDLTKAVADEAIERKDCVVVSYRMSIYENPLRLEDYSRTVDPIIFKGFKALTLADTQQQSLLRLALEGISVQLALIGSHECLLMRSLNRSTAPTQQSTQHLAV